MQPHSQYLTDALVPLYIGITGHRDIRPQDTETLKRIITGICQDLHAKYPTSHLILLTPLAEGADRLAARVVLDLGFQIVAPLPLPQVEYEEDFHSAPSRKEFRDLISRATRSFVVEPERHETHKGVADPLGDREEAYARVGRYVSQHAILLIALWDGVKKDSGSGTSQMVRFRLNGTVMTTPMSQSAFHNLHGGPVIHVVTPRISNPHPVLPPFSVRTYYPTFLGDPEIGHNVQRDILAHIETFNSEISRLSSSHTSRLTASEESILHHSAIPNPPKQTAANLHRFACADVLANSCKQSRVNTLVTLLSLVVLAFFYLQMYLEFWPDSLVLLVYPAVLGLAAIFFLWARHKRFDSNHEDYRALAEGLRVQIFWDLAKVNENAAHHYLYKHTGQLQWIRYALLAWWIDRDDHDTIHEQQAIEPPIPTVFKYWVLNQKDWYLARSRQIDKQVRTFEYTGNLLFVMAVALALALFATIRSTTLTLWIEEHFWIHHTIVVSVAMALAISAALHAYLDKLSLPETSKQYQRMVDLLSLAIAKLTPLVQALQFDATKQVLFELGKEALVEHGDWLILNRARPLELPKA